MEKKQAKRYVLTYLKDGEWEPLTFQELDRFEEEHPDIAKYWKEQSALESLQLAKFPENAPIYESWDKAAKRLLSNLKKSANAKYFQEPVDPKQDGAPNYSNVVSEPMDLGTVKQRLSTNYYHRMQEFLDDMSLIFDNCVKYHGSEDVNTAIAKAGRALREEFKKLYE